MKRFESIFENSPASLRAIIVMASVLLTVLAGMFLAIGSLIGSVVLSGASKTAAPSYWLMIVAIVLLVLILFLLLLLLGCSGCLSGKGRFPRQFLAILPILPHLPAILSQLPSALRALSTALSTTSQALNVVHTNLASAGTTLSLLSSIEVPSPIIDLEPTGTGFFYISNLDLTNTAPIPTDWLNPLKTAVDSLDSNLDGFGEVVIELVVAADLLDNLANAIEQP